MSLATRHIDPTIDLIDAVLAEVEANPVCWIVPAHDDIPATRKYTCGCWYSWDCGWSHCTDHHAPKGVLTRRGN